MDRACQESDVMVRIGNSLCNVTSLSRQQLTCRPPVTQPPGVDEDGHPNPQELPQVVVSTVDTEGDSVLPHLTGTCGVFI